MEYQIYLSIPEAGVSKTESKITIIGNIAATCSMKTEPDPPSGTNPTDKSVPAQINLALRPAYATFVKDRSYDGE